MFAPLAEPGSTVPASSGSIRDQQHPAVVVPDGIRFEALGRNDEDDVPIDGNEVFFGDESETESLPDSDPWKQDPDLSTSGWRLWTELIQLKNSTNAHTR